MSVTALKEVILPAAFSKDGVKFVGCSLDSEYKGGDQFQSNVVFVTAIVQDGEETKNIPLVVKFQPFDKELQKQLGTLVQFYNEVLVYSKLLPLLDRSNISADVFPKFYYGVGTLTTPENDVVVIEDLRPRGYKMTEERVFLDYEHSKLAMEKLGRFHALSYIAEKERPEEFFKLIASLKETTLINDAMPISATIRHCFHRALDPMIAAGQHSAVLQKLLSRVDDSVVKLLLEIVSPQPLAVLCHGDFCRNNMLFKYDQDGKPTDVKFFDIATVRYSSPVIDIAFFLFMNSSKEVRAAHWDDLIGAYHESLTSALDGVEGPTLQQLHQEIKRVGVYGYFHASFFLPMMLFENDFSIKELVSLTPDEVGARQAKIGGEEGTKLMVEMVEELFEREIISPGNFFLK